MSELLKYLNKPSVYMANSVCYNHYSNDKANRAIELLNKFNDYENGNNDRLKKTMTNANIPFKNYQKLNAKWFNDGINVDSTLYSSDMKTVMLHPHKSYGTCAIRSDLELKRNAYTYWQVTLEDRMHGTSIMIGVGTRKAKLNSIGYVNLLGSDQHSWGLSHKGYLWHSNKSKFYCNQLSSSDSSCISRIGCLYDGYRKTLSFFINDVYMGIAFENVLDNGGRRVDKEGVGVAGGLYPMVSSTVSQTIMKLDFFYQTFPSLQDICRRNLTKNDSLFTSIKLEYPYLPKFIIEYLEN